MLVLSRKKNESIVINGDIRIEILQIKGKQIRLGITAPSSMKVLRGELPQRMNAASEQPGEVTFEATIPFDAVGSKSEQTAEAPVGESVDERAEDGRLSPQSRFAESNLHDWVTAVMAAN